jgi:hypothetical protein
MVCPNNIKKPQGQNVITALPNVLLSTHAQKRGERDHRGQIFFAVQAGAHHDRHSHNPIATPISET